MDLANFMPWSALAGGLLIGLAALLLLLFDGRMAGVSQIVGRLLPWHDDSRWRLAFLAGLVAGAALCYALAGGAPAGRPAFPAWLLGAAGFLVGFGTSLGSGCTSGHGVCGLGRLSLRSLAATLVFLAVGMTTVFVVRHLAGIA